MYDLASTELRQKNRIIDMWRQGGGDTLVKVMAKGRVADPGRAVGYCTTVKYLAGRTPVQMEKIVGFEEGTILKDGAELFQVWPLPAPDQFLFRGYSYLPAGVPQIDGQVIDTRYPPGSGAPQWELKTYPQSGLRWLRTILPSQILVISYADLKPNAPAFIATSRS